MPEQENTAAGDSYTNRGRTEELKEYLKTMGFHDLDKNAPGPCFESYARKAMKKQQLPLVTYQEVAQATRLSHNFEYLGDRMKELDDKALAKAMLSQGESYYYSFCRDDLEQGNCTWHCKRCNKCQDWRTWHCKTCDRCQYGISIPCGKCTPEEYEARRGYD